MIPHVCITILVEFCFFFCNISFLITLSLMSLVPQCIIMPVGFLCISGVMTCMISLLLVSVSLTFTEWTVNIPDLLIFFNHLVTNDLYYLSNLRLLFFFIIFIVPYAGLLIFNSPLCFTVKNFNLLSSSGRDCFLNAGVLLLKTFLSLRSRVF